MREKNTPEKNRRSARRNSKKESQRRSGRHEDALTRQEIYYDERDEYGYEQDGWYPPSDYTEEDDLPVLRQDMYPDDVYEDDIVEYQGYYRDDDVDDYPVYDRASRRMAAKRERRRKVKITLIIILVIAVSLATAVTVGAYLVTYTPNILPNVYVDGVSVGGMSEEDAKAAIIASGWEEASAQMLEVRLLDKSSFEIDPCAAGARLTVDEAVDAAFAYGHGKNWYANLLSYVDCFLRPVDVNEQSLVHKRDYVLTQVEQGIAQLEAELGSGNYQVDEEASMLKIVKGAGQLEFDKEHMADAIYTTLQAGQMQLNYSTVTKEPVAPDFQAIYQDLSAEPADASYSDDNRFTVLPHTVGCDFDVEGAKELWNKAPLAATVEIPLDITYPQVTSDYLNSLLYRDLLGAMTTYYPNSNDNRISNLNLAASKINGIILYPGDEFSYNGTLGQRTEEAGYLPAGAYENGEVVEEVGGGICQVSSTLYSAMLYGYRLTTVERYPHYFPVDYLEKGYDATVSWPKPDFKFRNDRDFPIKIVARCDNEQRALTVEIWGTNLDGLYIHLDKQTLAYNNSRYPWIMEGHGVQVFRYVLDSNGMPVEQINEIYDIYHTHEATEQIKALDAQAAAAAAAGVPMG